MSAQNIYKIDPHPNENGMWIHSLYAYEETPKKWYDFVLKQDQPIDYNQKYKTSPEKIIRKICLYGYSNPSRTQKSIEKRKKTNLQRHGGSGFASKSIKEKFKETCIDKYGVDHPTKSMEVKEKVKQTNLERYGGTGFENAEIKEQFKKTMLERYGVDHHTKNSRWQEKHANKNPFNSSEKQKQFKEETISKYGGIGFGSKKIRDKIHNTNLEKYGTVNPSANKEVKQKRRDAFKEKYGVDWHFSSNEIKNQIIETNNEKYGCHPNSLDQKKQKASETYQKNYYGFILDDIKDEWRKSFLECGLEKTLEIYPKISRNTAIRNFLTDEEANEICFGSLEEGVVKYKLENSNLIFENNVRSIVPNNNRLEIDLLNRKHKISIEFNGFYWHQIKNDKIKDDIHKAESMRSIGYTHLALDETDLEKIEQISKIINPSKKKIYARNCEIREIQNPKDFLNKHHLQGTINSKISLGLFYEDKLIQVMTFGKPRFSQDYQYEMLRLCSHSDYLIVGGTQRLWKYFMAEHDPSSIVSYSDNKYFSGLIYNKLGFEFVENTSPNYVWWKNGVTLKRYQTMKHKLKDVLHDNFNPDLTEVQNMELNGWIKIKDLGNKKWRFINKL